MFEDVIRRHRPRGWRVSYTKTKDEAAAYAEAHPLEWTDREVAACFPMQRKITSPHITNPFTLHILLHEFAHVHLRHWDRGSSVSHREEFEAERWAMEIMRQEGIKVPKVSISRAKRYIRECIKSDLSKGVDIQPHIVRWASTGIRR